MPGKWSWANDQGPVLVSYNQDDMGLSPTVYWLDVGDANYYISRNKLAIYCK